MAVVIGSTGTDSHGAGQPNQQHIVYVTGSGRWWTFWVDLGVSATTLKSAYSADMLTWTAGATLTLTKTFSDGRSLALAYRQIASTDVVHFAISYSVATADHEQFYLRATISGTTCSYGTAAQIANTASFSLASAYDGCGIGFDSANKVHHLSGYMQASTSTVGDCYTARSTNADAGTSWTAGFPTSSVIAGSPSQFRSFTVIDLGVSANVLGIWDAGDAGNTWSGAPMQSGFNGTTWGTATNIDSNALTYGTQDKSDWSAVARTTGASADVHCVWRSGTNTYVHWRFSEALGSWAIGQTIPTQTSFSSGGVFLASDGTDVYLFVIDSAAGNAVKACRWSNAAGAWQQWLTVEQSSQTRTALSGCKTANNGVIGLVWSQQNGANYDLVTAPFLLTTRTPVPLSPYTGQL